MGDTYRDPVDHSRTHNQHAGESMIDTYIWPGFFMLAIGLLALACFVAAAAYNHHEWLWATGVIALTSLAAGTACIVVEHRRVLRIEARWIAHHPTAQSHRPVA